MTEEEVKQEVELIVATVLPEDAPAFPDDPNEEANQNAGTDVEDDELVDDPDDLIPEDEVID